MQSLRPAGWGGVVYLYRHTTEQPGCIRVCINSAIKSFQAVKGGQQWHSVSNYQEGINLHCAPILPIGWSDHADRMNHTIAAMRVSATLLNTHSYRRLSLASASCTKVSSCGGAGGHCMEQTRKTKNFANS